MTDPAAPTFIAEWFALLGGLVVLLGCVLLLIAGVGLLRLHDALSRQHAGTKAVTLALLLVGSGVALMMQDSGVVVRMAVLVVVLLATLPISSHMLARAAVAESRLDREAREAPLVSTKGDRPGVD